MAIYYKNVMPWGRSYYEYMRMFNLKETDLKGRILGCADGPASFNSVGSRMGIKTVSADPIYGCSGAEIEARINETFDVVITQTYRNRGNFIWREISSIRELGELRLFAMKIFLEDFERGKKEKRYIDAELPSLPFGGREFDLALCSHFLFLYTQNLSLEFHLEAVRELCRVSHEVRIFPLLDSNGILSPYLGKVLDLIIKEGKSAAVVRVNYEFLKRGNRMLVIKNA